MPVGAQRPSDRTVAAAAGEAAVVPTPIFSDLVQRYIVRGPRAGTAR